MWHKSVFDIYFTEYGTALTTVLPILFLYLNTVIVTAETLNRNESGRFGALKNLIQPTISLEMPVPSQGHYGFHSFPVVDWFCLFI